MSKRVISLCVTVLLVLPAAPVAARRGEWTPHQPVSIAGVIQPGAPVMRFDPNAAWLGPLPVTPTYQRTAPATVVGGNANTLALYPWLMPAVPTDPLCLRDERFSGMVDLGSPRMQGLLDTTWAVDIYVEMGGANSTYTVDFHLATPAGHWEGTLTGYGSGLDGPAHLHGLLLGDGDFSGDTAAVEMTRSTTGGGWDVAGTIY